MTRPLTRLAGPPRPTHGWWLALLVALATALLAGACQAGETNPPSSGGAADGSATAPTGAGTTGDRETAPPAPAGGAPAEATSAMAAGTLPAATAPPRPASPVSSAKQVTASPRAAQATVRSASPVASPSPAQSGRSPTAGGSPPAAPARSPVPAATTAPPPVPATATSAPTTARTRPVAHLQAGALWLVDAADSARQPRQITRRGDVQEVAWAPDGSRLAFAAGTGNGTELYVYDLTAQREQRLTNNQLWDGQPDWSPDGRTLIFTRGELGSAESGTEALAVTGEVWRIDADGQNARRLTAGKYPVWAPDGRRIAFVTNGVPSESGLRREGNELRLINAEGQNEWTVLRLGDLPIELDLSGTGLLFGPDPRLFLDPVWTGGGRVLAVNVLGQIGQIVSITDQARDLTVVAAIHEGNFGRLRSQPGGNRLAYEVLAPSGVRAVELSAYNLPLARRDGRVTIGGIRAGFEAIRPVWAPDGQSLAALTGQPEDPERTLRVYSPRGDEIGAPARGRITDLAWD